MAKFSKKGSKVTPAISTASLPDIVFMLLFFFMTVTTMKEVTYKVDIKPASATEVKKLVNKSLISYIYVGRPKSAFQGKMGKEAVIQLNDAFARIRDIGPYIQAERDAMDAENRSKMTTALKVDAGTKMGIVTDIKQELRRAQALKITYTADATTREDFF